MKQLIKDLISALEYHVEQTRPIHGTTVVLQAAKDALSKQGAGFSATSDERLMEMPNKDQMELMAWRFTGIAGLKRFISQKMYEVQTPAIKRWYEPFKCERCTTPQQCRPLNQKQINQLIKDAGYGDEQNEKISDFINGIAFAEAAHSIKE